MAPDVHLARRRRVRRLAVAHAVSVSGSQAAQIAVVYVIYTATHSGAWVIAALAASIGVNGLLGPAAGWVSDHFDRRPTMTSSELGAGLVYLLLVFAHRPMLLVLGSLAAAIVGSPFRSASAAAIPNLVSDKDLGWANGQVGAAFNLALVVGPIRGGVLLAASGSGRRIRRQRRQLSGLRRPHPHHRRPVRWSRWSSIGSPGDASGGNGRAPGTHPQPTTWTSGRSERPCVRSIR